MTIHIHINNQEAEKQLTAMAAEKNSTIEEQASKFLIDSLREREIKLMRLKEEVKKGIDQIREGRVFKQSLNETLEKFKTEHNAR
ncbi:MAG: hypothetical protein ACC707_12890 [Thiohalomonadales bacterium]